MWQELHVVGATWWLLPDRVDVVLVPAGDGVPVEERLSYFHEIALFPCGDGDPGAPCVCHQLYHFTLIYTRFPLPFHCLFIQSGKVLLKLVTFCSSPYYVE